MQESRDKIGEMLEFTKACLGNTQRVLEQKDEEVASLRAPLVNAQDQLRAEDEIIDDKGRDKIVLILVPVLRSIHAGGGGGAGRLLGCVEPDQHEPGKHE